jgi:hypothetical protein
VPFVLGAAPPRLLGADAAAFVLEAGSCTAGARVDAGSGCDLVLGYAPQAATPAAAVQQAELRIEYTGLARATVVALRGLAEPRAAATLSASGLSFAAQPAGSASTPQRVSLTNSGQAVLGLQSLRLSGPAADDFLLAGSCDASLQLAPGAQCTFEIRFAPAAAGPRIAELAAPFDGGAISLALSGNGEPAIAAPPAAAPPSAAAPPTAVPAPSAAGGGGGALSPAGLALLCLLLLQRRSNSLRAGRARAGVVMRLPLRDWTLQRLRSRRVGRAWACSP